MSVRVAAIRQLVNGGVSEERGRDPAINGISEDYGSDEFETFSDGDKEEEEGEKEEEEEEEGEEEEEDEEEEEVTKQSVQEMDSSITNEVCP